MTTLNHPNDDLKQPKITADPAVNLNRTAREYLNHYFDQAQEHVLNMRETIKAQAAQIATLENEVEIQKSYASEYHCDCAVLEASLHRVNQERGEMHDQIQNLKACVLKAGIYQGELEAENTELKRLNSSMHDRLTAHAEARYHGRERMAEDFADMVLDQPNLARTMKQHQMDRMENVCRLANAARSHIERGNYEAADTLLSPLAQGVHDAYIDDGDTEIEFGS